MPIDPKNAPRDTRPGNKVTNDSRRKTPKGGAGKPATRKGK